MASNVVRSTTTHPSYSEMPISDIFEIQSLQLDMKPGTDIVVATVGLETGYRNGSYFCNIVARSVFDKKEYSLCDELLVQVDGPPAQIEMDVRHLPDGDYQLLINICYINGGVVYDDKDVFEDRIKRNSVKEYEKTTIKRKHYAETMQK